MRLIVLGSNSLGNCYILENKKEALIIEAGVPFQEVKKAMNYDIGKIVGGWLVMSIMTMPATTWNFLVSVFPCYLRKPYIIIRGVR